MLNVFVIMIIGKKMTEEQWGINDMDFSQPPVNTSSVRI